MVVPIIYLLIYKIPDKVININIRYIYLIMINKLAQLVERISCSMFFVGSNPAMPINSIKYILSYIYEWGTIHNKKNKA